MQKTLLFCAHPGHELRVWGWLRQNRPTVCYLTDGSGADGGSRLSLSLDMLAEVGAVFDESFGTVSDRAVYDALMNKDLPFFEDRSKRLAQLMAAGYGTVAGDAAEGYNPSHDVARMLINSAVDANRNVQIENLAFPLMSHPHQAPPGCDEAASPLELSDDALREKVERGRGYALETGGTLAREVDETIARMGLDTFRVEHLFGVTSGARTFNTFDRERPYYETYGERQVAAGKYMSVIRWAEHVRPVAERLGQIASSHAP